MKTGILCFLSKRYINPLYWLSTTPSDRFSAIRVVERDLAGDIDAELGRALDIVEEVGRLQEGLRRNASAMQAAPAEDQLLDDGHVQAKLLGADCRHVTAGAATEQDEIKLVGRGRNVRHYPAELLVINAGARPAVHRVHCPVLHPGSIR